MALVAGPESRIPLAFNEGRLLEVLAEKLPQYLTVEDAQTLLSELRSELYADIGDDSARNLHSITLNCHRCPELGEANLPIWNVVDPDVVFVASGPFINKDAQEMFVNTLKKVGFSSANICLTYLNRCLPKARVRAHSDEEAQNCLPFLQAELQILKPKLTVILGKTPSVALLGSDVKLKNERGIIHWLGPWAFLPTFTPTYILNGGVDHLNEMFVDDIQNAYNFVYGD